MTKIYKKQVKKHEEVWAEGDDEQFEEHRRVRVCVGNSNYGRLYVQWDWERGEFLNDKDTETAFKLFKEIWADNVDNKPFSE